MVRGFLWGMRLRSIDVGRDLLIGRGERFSVVHVARFAVGLGPRFAVGHCVRFLSASLYVSKRGAY